MPAISEPKTHSFWGNSGDMALSTRRSLASAIVRFWCAKQANLLKSSFFFVFPAKGKFNARSPSNTVSAEKNRQTGAQRGSRVRPHMLTKARLPPSREKLRFLLCDLFWDAKVVQFLPTFITSQELGCRKWGFKRQGFKQICGYLRKKAFFLRYLDCAGALRTLRKRARRAEKGRKRPISADFQEGRPDTA